MKKPIDFDDLFNRVSDNREFALRMLHTFFDGYNERFDTLNSLLKEHEFDALADSAHQMKGIVGNLAFPRVHSTLKSMHEAAKLKESKKMEKLIKQLDQEISAAKDFLEKNMHLFN